MGFGWKIVDMYRALVTNRLGQAPWPEEVPGAMASFMEMPDDSEMMLFADLQSVYNYLRRNRRLVIPKHWQELVPKPS